MISFVVIGKPATAGNKRPLPFRRRDGSLGVNVVEGRTKEAKEHAQTWRGDVRDAARKAYSGPLLEGPLAVSMTFVRQRPRAHFKASGGLKPKAPAWPTTRPDVLKTARAAEDALTGVIFGDDSQIVEERLSKVWGSPDRLEIRVARPGGLDAVGSGDTDGTP